MKMLNYDDFESIVLKETYIFPPQDINRLLWSLEIQKNGFILEKDSENNEEHTYSAKENDIKELYGTLMEFLENIVDIEETTDDTAREMTINYKNIRIATSFLARNEKKEKIIGIIDKFIDKKATENSRDVI